MEEKIKNRSMAYVAMTRAIQGLVISSSRKSSRFIAEMNKKVYNFEGKQLFATPTRIFSISAGSTTNSTLPGLTRIGRTTSTTASTKSVSDGAVTPCRGLKGYFQSKGLEVIDKRSNGGCLWVVGDETKLKPYIDDVKKMFGAYGNFGSGRATKQRLGWFTKCTK